MGRRIFNTNFFWVLLGSALVAFVSNPSSGKGRYAHLLAPPDSVPADNTNDRYIKDRYGDEISNPPSKSPMQLKDPSNVEKKVEINEDLRSYTIEENIGESDYRPPTELNFQEFAEYQRKRMIQEYWKAKVDQDNPNKKDQLAPPLFEIKHQGKPLVEIRPSGFVSLEIGGRWQRVDNPAVPIAQQRTGGFDFDQQISLNLDGTIGERVKVKMNWDTKATFDFDNNIKISYQGKDRDILQEIQAGNVSMPLNNSLIRGAQNLFGIKAKLQFGKLTVTALVSNQRGKTDTEVFKSGAKTQTFDIIGSEYDKNRHFFLAQFFRNRFNQAYVANPTNPNTGLKITRVEVYVTNSGSKTSDLRDFVGFTDLGENGPDGATLGSYIYNKNIVKPDPTLYQADNSANSLYKTVTQDSTVRNSNQVVSYLRNLGLESSKDFERVTSARKLKDNEFSYHPDLGYVSLNFSLKDDEAIAVSYEYTFQGRRYKVGELTEDYQKLDAKQSIVMKLLKPQSLDIGLPTWNLMMKNVYRINSSSIQQENFRLKVIYKDDRTGIDNPSLQEGKNIKDVPLVQLLNMDKLNLNGDLVPDGNFDYIENATINSKNGFVIFPVLEPFGNDLEQVFQRNDPADANRLSSKYIFKDLYVNTQNQARQQTSKNKFFISGQYESSVYGDIRLKAFNVDEKSVSISVGSVSLQPGIDFTVNNGQVKILNAGALASGNDIIVKYESPEYFSFRQKSLLGTRLDYKLNKDVTFGATMLHLNERPLITRVNAGDEPISNTQMGVDIHYKEESRLLTKMVDALPVIQTKAPSTVAATWEAATIIPGAAKQIGKDGGTAYIDDFEGSANYQDFSSQILLWQLSSTPRRLGNSILDYSDWLSDSLDYSYHRAKLSFFNVDRSFYVDGGNNGLTLQTDEKTNHYTRPVEPQEIYPNFNNRQTTTYENLFNVVYYPSERGPYNFNTNKTELASDGRFVNPKNNWAGITRAIATDTDFDNANIEYLEFWLMDPYHNGGAELAKVMPEYRTELNTNPDLGGDLYFNLGDISEDFVKDARHGFENGLPDNVEPTAWGEVTSDQYINNAFDNTKDRSLQDVGMDGINTEREKIKFQTKVNEIQSPYFDPSSPYVSGFVNDPSSDDFKYYTTGSGDNRPLLDRYKNFSSLENNSPVNSGGSYTPASKSIPDNEDLNGDKTLNINDKYYQYKVTISQNMSSGSHPYIIGENVSSKGVKWYQFRIPVKSNYENIGEMSGFQTIKFFRMFMTNFKSPVVLRMSQLRLVSSQWRPKAFANTDLGTTTEIIPNEQGGSLEISAVNIEENGSGSPTTSPYKLPPSSIRDYDQSSNITRQLNEQSLRVCVDNFAARTTQGAFKNIVNDLIAYKRLKLYVHAETSDPFSTRDNDIHAIVRLGTDIDQNYYEISYPLKLSDIKSGDQNEIWPEENMLDIAIKDLVDAKLARNGQSTVRPDSFFVYSGRYKIRVIGNPDIRTVRSVYLGAYNPQNTTGNKKVCLWFDELRVTDFDKDAGWATTGNVTAQLADLGTVSTSGRYVTPGYGDIESKIGDLTRETSIKYGASTNLAMDKFIPGKTGVQLPLFMSYDKEQIRPKYDPLQPDVLLDDAINAIDDAEKRNEYEQKVTYNKTIKSINLTNVRKTKVKPDAKPHIYDIENFSVSAGYSVEDRGGIGNKTNAGNNLASYRQQKYNGVANYSFSPKDRTIEPLSKVGFLKSNQLALIRDVNFNPVPNSFAVTGSLNRTYTKTQLYNDQLTIAGVTPTYEKSFFFNRNYNFRWNMTKSISLNYQANANAIIDEPNGDRNGNPDNSSSGYVQDKQQYKDSVSANLYRFGRLKNFDQTISANYQLPLNKIPALSFINSDATYKAGYNWKAGAFGLADTLGNTINNNRDIALDGKMNFTQIYRKNKMLKKIESPVSTAKNKEGEKPEGQGYRYLRPFLSLRNISGRYSLNYTTGIPGFLPKPKFFGIDNSSDNAPGWGFVLGDQNTEGMKKNLVENQWYTKSKVQNQPIVQTKTEGYDFKALIEPINDLRINLSAKETHSRSYSEIFRLNTTATGENIGISETPVVSGNYSVSFQAYNTAFKSPDAVFASFEKNRYIIQERRLAGGYQYDKNSQEVLIPAFLSAYSGESAENTKLSNKPKMMLPNWRVDYAGLSKLPILKKSFSSVNISHGYTSNYDISNYASSLQYTEGGVYRTSGLDEQGFKKDSAGNIVSKFVISQVAISERFSPLVGINIRTKSRMTYRFDYNKERTMDLNMANRQVTEVRSQDFVFGFGWTKSGMRLPIKQEGTKVTLKNDVTFKLDVTIKETETTQRKIEGTKTTTAGNWNFQFKPNISYMVNQRVNLQLFFERTINEPKISSSFRRATTAVGFRLRFNLS